MIRCVIVEDEPLALERAINYVEKISYLQLQATFENAILALEYLHQHQIDLLFLDINLGEVSGLDLMQKIKFKPYIIFTTAYTEFALKGYELQITDYLLKPYTFERFFQAVDKVYQLFKSKQIQTDKNFLFVKTEYRLEKVQYADIVYIEGQKDYRKLVLPQQQIMTLMTFAELEREIPEKYVCRVHKSFMVGVSHIHSIEKDRIKIKDQLIPVSDTYKQKFYAIIL